MKYSALIRKLIKASEASKWRKEDVAYLLKERCVYGIDIIRQTLMNAVCDPRFRMHISSIPKWREIAICRLETFATKLMSVQNLTEEFALTELDNMLSEWIEHMMIASEEVDRQINFISYNKLSSQERLKKALEDYVNGIPKEEEDDSELKLLWSGEETIDPLGCYESIEDGPDMDIQEHDDSSNDNEDSTDENGKKEGDKDKETKEEDAIDNLNKPISNYGAPANNGTGTGRGNEREIEERFFSNVPPSLVELAKRIGRSSNFGEETSGTFMTASKSDIAGITTGDNLNCILPSELALMASTTTEDIFYKNYVTKNLQLFANASRSPKSKRHLEGPIIICLDTSSSMLGEPIIVAKALTFAVCIIAQRKKRKVIIVKYSSTHEPFFLHNISTERADLLEFLKYADSGGNNENAMFKWLFSELLPSCGDYQNGDILCVSDFGWIPISPETMALINEEKQKNMKFYGLNIDDENANHNFEQTWGLIGGNEEEWASPYSVCDSLWEYRNGVCKEVTSELSEK
ncbi:MAG: hypothetical protein KBT32_11725 [Bacteroidales bacterium]|nr:hypothetical protein [Candidatus Physcocola equi]